MSQMELFKTVTEVKLPKRLVGAVSKIRCPMCHKTDCAEPMCIWETLAKNKRDGIEPNEPEAMRRLSSNRHETYTEWRARARSAARRFSNRGWVSRDEFFEGHGEYLKSPEWRKLRRHVLQRDGHLCQICGHGWASQVHHLRYDDWGQEDPADLISVCKPCHDIEHGVYWQ